MIFMSFHWVACVYLICIFLYLYHMCLRMSMSQDSGGFRFFATHPYNYQIICIYSIYSYISANVYIYITYTGDPCN